MSFLNILINEKTFLQFFYPRTHKTNIIYSTSIQAPFRKDKYKLMKKINSNRKWHILDINEQ